MTTPAQEAAIQAMYAAVPENIREDLALAIWWAVATLAQHEGAGHVFQVTAELSADDIGVSCEFSKPEWSGSHVGLQMKTASEAVVMAVCEYLNGA